MPVAVVYPRFITLSATAEGYLDQLGVDLIAGNVELSQCPPSIRQLFVFAWTQGSASRQAEVDRSESDANRLYKALYNPRPKMNPNRLSYADLERRRGNPERAVQIEQDLERKFEEAA